MSKYWRVLNSVGETFFSPTLSRPNRINREHVSYRLTRTALVLCSENNRRDEWINTTQRNIGPDKKKGLISQQSARSRDTPEQETGVVCQPRKIEPKTNPESFEFPCEKRSHLLHHFSLRKLVELTKPRLNKFFFENPRFFHFELSGGLSARSVASEALCMKKSHQETPTPALVHQARRLLLSASLDIGPQVECREVADILAAATYFGLGNDCALVRQCVEWCKKYEREIQPETMGTVVKACATLGDTVSTEVVSNLSIRAMRLSRYFDSKAVTQLISAFSEAGVFQDKLALYLSRRFVTLGKIGEFNCKQLVTIISGLAKSKYHNVHIRSVISRRISYLREQFKASDLVPLVVGVARLRIREERIIKKLAAKSVEIAEQMTSTQVCTLFQAFAYFGVKYDQLFGVLTNRAVELMDAFTAKHISLTLASFQKISISNPELFDNLAERAMSVMQDHDSADIAHILSSLVHFGITDDELLRRLAEQSIATASLFTEKQLTVTLYAFAKLNYVHQDFLRAMASKVAQLCGIMTADQLRSVLWAFAKLSFKEDEKLIRTLLGKAYSLHFEFFRNNENAEEIEEIFDAFGREICPELYDLYISRDSPPASPPSEKFDG